MSSQQAYDSLADKLAPAGITKSNMFGMPVLKIGSKPVCGLEDDGVSFKLPADSDEMKLALSLEGAHLFQPEMHGRKGPLMKQWVVVPSKHEEHYDKLISCSIAFVEREMSGK